MSSGELAPILVVGGGRAGSALHAALERARPGCVHLWHRGLAASELGRPLAATATLLLAVADEALEAAIEEWLVPAWPKRAPGPRVALHLAGAWPSSRLAALGERGAALGVFHPVVALSGAASAAALAGASVTISGDPAARDAARRLAALLSMRPLEVDDALRPLLHLGAVMAAGDLVALLSLAEGVVSRAGVAPADATSLVAELASSALAGYARRGAADALTGPVPRGDLETLSRHAEAARDRGLDPRALRAHALLAEAASALLEGSGRLDAATVRAIRARLRAL